MSKTGNPENLSAPHAPEHSEPGRYSSGFVSILGRPNAGKSTLLNALVGMKVAIVADKPQTTRTAIQGVVTLPGAQIVFVDTPGIHKADSPINKRMMEEVRAALDQRDLLLFLADSTHKLSENGRRALDLLRTAETATILVLTKIDLVPDKRELLPLIEAYKSEFAFAAYVPVSARTGDGLDALREEIVARLPEGPQYFPADHVTDQPERFLTAELIREQVLLLTREEVPHSVAVLIDRWDEKGPITRIYATVYVERSGQKKIVIGAKGSMLKQIGTRARGEIERLLSRRVYLELFVKVEPGWRERPAFLNALDWRRMTGADDTRTGRRNS
jgi:GTP-binding protein Era